MGTRWGTARLMRWFGVGLSGAVLQLGGPLLPPSLDGIIEDLFGGPAPPSPPGQLPREAQPMGIRAVHTGDRSERLRSVPITKEREHGLRSVMSLGPRRIGRLYKGDELRVSTEVQVSTTCFDPSPRCHGKRYRFDPTVAIRLVLAPRPGTTAPARTAPISGWHARECTQRRPSRNHHCVLVIRSARKRVVDPVGLPCDRPDCRINLVMSAFHPGGGGGERVVVGGDARNGRIVQDRGRVNATVIHRRAQARVGRTASRRARARSLPVRGSGHRRVVASVRLPNPRKGERLEVRGSFVSALNGLPHNALISSQLIAATSPTATYPREARRVVTARGQLSEQNGFNCTHGASGFSNPCTSVKVGLGTIRRDPRDILGRTNPLFINLIARAQPKLAVGRPGVRVRVRDARIAVTRFKPIRRRELDL